MKIQDKPTTIYVRDIDESTSEKICQLKKRFSTNSNNELVKRLINNFEAKEKKIDRYERELDQQKNKIEKMERVIRNFQNAQSALIDFKL
ncbi:hypothetical protein MTsPCn9_34120 [Croceitalea sp. MTPC9]|uniref:hypothetical protein n=1 Tax=unclassified Croceitalea TaxID=2632280 RepID=UPI002B3B5431|nr:hypothetical protein MTsPCn6_34830 [Croceitalea sp. MTPC6]GMN18472.1 hypothetical protein MTsPCn9_34120 [Croceitalea sp. MTPC9]